MHFENAVAMQYNRIGEAFLFLAAVILFIPPREKMSGVVSILEATASGILIGLLFFVKINFFILGVGFLGASFIFPRTSLLQRSLTCAGVVVTIVLYLHFVQFTLSEYLGDLGLASASQSFLKRFSGLVKVSGLVPEIVTVCILGIITSKELRFPPGLNFRAKQFGVVLVVVLAGVFAQATNAGGLEEPCFVLAGLIAFFPLIESQRVEGGNGSCPSFLVASLLLISLFSRTLMIDGVSMVHKIMYNHQHQRENDPAFILLTGNPYPSLRFGDECRSYISDLNSGIELILSQVKDPGAERISTPEFANPFPPLVGARYAKGDALWWHESVNYSERSFPSPNRTWNNTTLLIESKGGTADPLGLPEYADYKKRHFRLLADNATWRLYRRISP